MNFNRGDSTSPRETHVDAAAAHSTASPKKGSALPLRSQKNSKIKAKMKPVTRVFEVRDSGVQTPALDRSLALLEFISAHSEGVTTGEIRASLGFSANLVFRLTKALSVHGYVERDLSGTRFLLTQK